MHSTAGSLVRPSIRALKAYTPGEQPRIPGLIKLNTNENPYPPSPKVLRAIKNAVDGRLRLYPNPTAEPLREKLAKLHRCHPENIIVGNGSDELLAMAVRTFVEPAPDKQGDSSGSSKALSKCTVQFFVPSYSLYPVLAEIHGAAILPQPLTKDFGLPSVSGLKRNRLWDFHAALTLVTTPNAPSGRGYRTTELEALCQAQKGIVVLDEAYVDFAEGNALALGLKYSNVLVARTFSKAYSLCFQRVGYMVGNVDLIGGLQKIRDSYNVNGLGQVAALATLDDLDYYQANFRKIIATRTKLISQLQELDFEVFPSQTNFILVRPPRFSAQAWLERLRRLKVLVRWFDLSTVRDFLRITIGTPTEAAAFVKAVKAIFSRSSFHE